MLGTIVWAIACDNADLRDGNCIGREWLAKTPGGAVAHYGATRESDTQDNNTLEDRLFRAVWDKGVTNLAHATTWAEDQCLLWNFGYAESNAWKYTLFGDPDMNVRREMPPTWQVVAPATISLIGGHASVDIQVTDTSGLPVPGALVGMWKPSATVPEASAHVRSAGVASGGDEVADNAYTGDDGRVHFDVSPQSTGYIHYSVRDTAGTSVVDSIRVERSNAVPVNDPGRFTVSAIPTLTHGRTTLRFSRPLETSAVVRIVDAAGHRVAELPAPRGAWELAWPGLDRSGLPVRSGVYFASVRSEEVNAVVRVVVRR